MSKLTDWLSTEERRIAFAEEALIVDVAEQIWAAMECAKVSKSEIAERLGKSKALISQMLTGSRNMTLRTLADIAYCIGYKVNVSLDRHNSVGAWQNISGASVVLCDHRFLNTPPSPEPVRTVSKGTWTPILNRAA